VTSKTEQLASFIIDTDFGGIPKELVSLARKAILDYLGVTLAGSKLGQSADLIADYVKRCGANSEAAVIGKGFRTSVEMAALANGTIGHALDFDDAYPIHLGIPAHPSVPVIPCILALGEKHHVSGEEVLTSFVLGFEVETRVGSIFGSSLVALGWHTTPIMGSIGAAAAASRVLRLDTDKTRNALGIAASLASGLKHNFGTMTKSLHAGNAARNGVIAGMLAEQGFTASRDIFDAPANFLGAFYGGREPDLTGLTRDLASAWLMSHGIGFKPYPACRTAHAGIDAALEMRNRYQLDAARITEIVCQASELVYAELAYHRPQTGLEAKFSLEYCISAALLDGQVSLEHFNTEKVLEPRVQELINRVRLEPDTGERAYHDIGHQLTVRLDNGSEYSLRVSLPRGEPDNPMTEEDMIAKFRDCAHLALSPADIERCLQLVLNLESAPDVTDLMTICCGKK
jgi:2-methylcitrate dehydratase PrpD